MMMSTSLACSREQRHLGLDELIAHLLGVAATAAAFLVTKVQLQEFRAHAFNLFLHLQPGVESAHDGAQAVGGANRGQAGDPRHQ